MKNLKRVLAVVLCVATLMSLMPLMFASAADATVAKQDELADFGTVIVEWVKLWGGMLVTAIGPVVKENIGPALKDLFLGNLGIGEFFGSLGDIVKDIVPGC